jgi:hypothetical protein
MQSTHLPRVRATVPQANQVGFLSSPVCKNILIFRNPNQVYIDSRPAPPRGAFRDRHERWRRDAVDAVGAKDGRRRRGRRSRVVLTPSRRCQVGGSTRRRRWQKSAAHRGEHEGNRKTIARGMPGVAGVTVVTTLVCFLFCTQGCGRIARPAFPAPSDFHGAGLFLANLGRIAPRECCCTSLRANGSRECAPGDRLREAIQLSCGS